MGSWTCFLEGEAERFLHTSARTPARLCLHVPSGQKRSGGECGRTGERMQPVRSRWRRREAGFLLLVAPQRRGELRNTQWFHHFGHNRGGLFLIVSDYFTSCGPETFWSAPKTAGETIWPHHTRADARFLCVRERWETQRMRERFYARLSVCVREWGCVCVGDLLSIHAWVK